MSQAADSDLDFNLQAKHSRQKIEEIPEQPQGWSEQLAEPVTSLQSNLDPPLPFLRLSHADPLMPMQERDLTAIRELFEQEDIEAIEADIVQNLSHYKPELQWEDWGAAVSRDRFAQF